MVDPLLVGAVIVALGSAYTYRADFARYSIFTVGVFKRVERRAVEGVEYECADPMCEAHTDVAERRRWFKEIVVAGMPVAGYGGGTAHYCEDHVAFEILDELDNPTKTRTERLKVTLLEGIVAFLAFELEPREDSDLANASDDLVSGVGDAMSLLPVVFVVLIAVIFMSLLKVGRPSMEVE